jgi:hypothetical protein
LKKSFPFADQFRAKQELLNPGVKIENRVYNQERYPLPIKGKKNGFLFPIPDQGAREKGYLLATRPYSTNKATKAAVL